MKKDDRLWIGGGTGEKAFDHAAVLILKYMPIFIAAHALSCPLSKKVFFMLSHHVFQKFWNIIGLVHLREISNFFHPVQGILND